MDAPSQSRSVWMGHASFESGALTSDARADVCVIGAGIAGISAAYMLMKKGRKVIVVDDGPVGGGMSSRTTAHVTQVLGERYYEMERLHGEDGARLVAASHGAAIAAMEAICTHEGLECDFSRVDGFLFLPREGDPDELVLEYGAALRAQVEGLAWVDRAPIADFDTGRCLRFPRQAQVHPLKYLNGLARALHRGGCLVHTGVRAVQVQDGDAPCVRTSGGHRIDCGAVVVATHAPFNDRIAIHAKQAPHTRYALALRVPRGTVAPALYRDTGERPHLVRLDVHDGEILIVSGEDHRTGEAHDASQRHGALALWARERFPASREVLNRWSWQLMKSADALAYVGRNPGDRNIYVATGDGGMAMTYGTIAGIVIADLIDGTRVPWADLYDPARFTMKAAAHYARGNASFLWHYRDWLRRGDVESSSEIAPGSGGVARRGVHLVAAYRDRDGELHEFSAACTHLGCVVRWNPDESTWDCGCHGSRFDALGGVLSGPAAEPLRPVEKPGEARVRISRHEGERPPTKPPAP